ncbi:ATP-grasp domain-containing protein [Kutzneria sp. CA-103260]|uniref:ATP-grasp domain-containing protein n=1 Tax=Kutzneria sp. CA-103260 TaxID=2802641 RepID=UPI001BA98326|nr:ATP-grasp domain-containing protein [Kutzneria sp. CA-103260]QUQ63817.1 pyridoxal-phosphate dependent enzyme [Kutzneria sp. CA-103260]
MADRTLLVLGCASVTPHGRDQMRRLSDQARRRGVHVLGADTAANLAKADLIGLVGETVAVDVHSPAAVREWAATRVDVGAVLTFREMCVESVAAAASALGIAGNAPDVVHTIRTKDLCREALRSWGFRQPECAVVVDADEARAFLARTRGPWVVKPRDGMGSVGVSLVDSVDALPAALALLPAGVPFLVETFVTGREFSAEGLFIGGRPTVLALTAKTTGAGFVETGHRMPADLDDALARAEVERAVTAVGLTHGVFHVEFWVDGTDVVLGEVHARPGGDFIHAMVEHVRPGLELYGALMDDLFGEPPLDLPAVTAAAGVEFLVLPPGEVLSIRGWDDVLADPAVIAADLSVRPGDVIGPVRGSADRHGVLVVGGPTAAAVERTLRRLADTVSVEVAENQA